MQAIILAGGLGTRLRELYPDIPKALVPILGKPFLAWQIEWLRHGGATGIHIAAGHKASAVKDWLKTDPAGAGVTLSEEPQPLGTAGGLRFVEEHLRSDPFLVLNGDSLTPNLDFRAMEKTHSDADGILTTIAVVRSEESGRYGTVEFDITHHITAFREKSERKAGWINTGVYLMSRKTLALIEADKPVSMETDVFPRMAARRQLLAFQAPSPMLDMGTPEGIRAMESFLSAQPPATSR